MSDIRLTFTTTKSGFASAEATNNHQLCVCRSTSVRANRTLVNSRNKHQFLYIYQQQFRANGTHNTATVQNPEPLPVTMDLRVIKLIEEFEQAGWKSHGSIDTKRDWWFEDIIMLISAWRPVGVPLYVTLLIDPLSIDRKVVWAVNISSSLPEQNNLKSIQQITLNDVKRTNLTELIKEINLIVLESRRPQWGYHGFNAIDAKEYIFGCVLTCMIRREPPIGVSLRQAQGKLGSA